LKALFALVNGESPALLEDDHHYTLVEDALQAYEQWKEADKP